MWMGLVGVAMAIGGGAGVAVLLAGQPWWLALLLYSLVGAFSLGTLGLLCALRHRAPREAARVVPITLRN